MRRPTPATSARRSTTSAAVFFSPRPLIALLTAVLVIVGAVWTVAPEARAENSLAMQDPDPAEGTESDAPAAPADVTVVAADRSLEVSWSDPQVAGGSQALGYEIATTPHDTNLAPPPVMAVGGDTFTATIPSLINGELYSVSVTARDEVASSLPGSASGKPRTTPGAPTVRSVDAGDGSVLVSWAPPADDGGAAIGTYVIEAEPSGTTLEVDGATTSARVFSLKNGAPTSFSVTAANEAGDGPPSAASAAVTPRGVGRFVIRRQPAHRILYGAPSTVKASVVTRTGVGIPAQRVELLAKVRPSTRWRRLAAETTGGQGKVTLRATLPASAALRLRHPTGDVVASDAAVRSVVVAKRVTVKQGATRTRAGMPVVVRGRVSPQQRTGSSVRLQQRVSGSWRKVATGRMISASRYIIRWEPQHVGNYTLRVMKPHDARHAAGRSTTWHHRVDPETAADIAKDILRNDRITLARVHVSGGGYLASAHENMVDVAHGRPARRSCHGGAPCGTTRIDVRVLEALQDMGTRGSLSVSEIAGGVHSSGSAHYSGRGLDINWVNKRHVGWGSDYRMVVDRCRAHGAKQVLTPGNDPYGGHHNHVHCGWE